jgi:hypothetical protein
MIMITLENSVLRGVFRRKKVNAAGELRTSIKKSSIIYIGEEDSVRGLALDSSD